MMMNAYNELYVSDAALSLGEYFDYMVCDLHYKIDEAFSWLAHSKSGKCFGEGNPRFVSGMTGIELARNVIFDITRIWEDTEASQPTEKSVEYWMGWSLAQYQWKRGYSFLELERKGLAASRLRAMYIFHEADIEKFYAEVDALILPEEAIAGRLKRMRTYAGYTQKKLSEDSGVALRMIQLYEQGRNDIRKASAETAISLSRTLHCKVEDIC